MARQKAIGQIIKYAKSLKKVVKKGQRKTAERLLERTIEYTPTDTFALIGGYYIREDGNITRVGNDVAYAHFIEFNTPGQRLQNFHKGPPRSPATVFRTSGSYNGLPGARMMTQARDETVQDFRQFIAASINGIKV